MNGIDLRTLMGSAAPTPVTSTYGFGTVTGTVPLRVQLDTDSGPVASTPIPLCVCHVGDRVWCQITPQRQLIIEGVVGGPLADYPTAWTGYTPQLYQDATNTRTAIGTTVNYARWHYRDAHTVEAYGSVSRQAGASLTNGVGCSLPVAATSLLRVLNVGTLTVHGSTAPTTQSEIAVVSPDKTTIIPYIYSNGFLAVDANLEFRFNVSYEV